MGLTRRGVLGLVGGGVVLAAGGGAWAALRAPAGPVAPWGAAGAYAEPRRRALSWALLAPNPHNRQPWLADLREEGVVTLHVDLDRLLPQTDPFARQITIGLGAFLELMRMAAAEDGYRVDLTLFPQGEDPERLDGRPIARAVFVADPSVPRDPLFAVVPARRSNKQPYDTARPVPEAALAEIGAATTATRFGATSDPVEVEYWRALTLAALRIELDTPRTAQESVDLFRIGKAEVEANPDGITFTGPLFESLHLTGLFTRESAMRPGSIIYDAALDAVAANANSAMAHLWIVTPGNARTDQIAAGADWLRVNLAATRLGLGLQPMSQALQEFPEMAALYSEVHGRLAPGSGTVQMLGRVGYGPEVGPSPRWPLEAKIVDA